MAHGADYLRRPDKNTIPESNSKIKGNALPSKTWIAAGGETPPLILPSCSHAGVVLSRRLPVDADMGGHCTNPTIQPCDPAAILPDRRLAARLFSAKCHLNLWPPAETDGTRDSSGNSMPQPGERSSGYSSLDTGRAPQTTCHGVVWLMPAGCPDSAPAGGLSGRFIRKPTETPMISKLMPKIEVEGSHPQGGRLVVVTSGAFLTQHLSGSVLTETRRSVS
jgi:hypothetical protein